MSIFTELKTRQIDTRAEYHRLVRQIAHGEHVDPEAVLVVLERSGCDAEQLEKDAAALEARIVAARTLEQLPAAEDERRRLKETQAKVANDFDAIRRKHENAMRRIDADLAVASEKARECRDARRLLHATASAEARAHLVAAQANVSAIMASIRAAEDRKRQLLVDQERATEAKRSRIVLSGERGDPLGDSITRMESQITELDAEVKRLDADLGAANQAVREAEAGLLVP